MYPNKSSPTVAVHSVFTALGLASGKRWRIVVKIDIKGAFVQTLMEGEVYMKVNQKMASYVINMFPDLKEMVHDDGCLYTLLLKAMYGCIQASALWYALIRSFLEELGYECSETNKCVFRLVGDRIFILLLYVDDILALVDADEAKRLRQHLEKRFGTVQCEISKKLSYLGMQLDIKDDGAIVDMTFYVEKLLEGLTLTMMSLPGNHNMFIVDDKAKLLNEEDRKFFHSSTAKLLCLAKRA
jgi:hypothetical protein